MKKLYYPVICKQKIAFTREDDRGSYILSEYSVNNEEIFLNETATIILKLCDENNSLDSIIKSIEKQFSNTNRKVIEQDTELLLHKLWQRGIITWKNNENPFESDYLVEKGDYTYCLGNIDLVEEYEHVKLDRSITDVRFKEAVILKKEFLLLSFLNGRSTVYVLRYKDKEVMKVCLEIGSTEESLYIKNIAFSDEAIERYLECAQFLEWIGRALAKKLSIKNMINILLFMDLGNEYMKMIQNMGFENKGILKEEICVDKTYYDVAVYSKNIRISE